MANKEIKKWFEDKPVYYKWLISGLCLLGGGFLVLEHWFTKHYFDVPEFGHEWYGLGLIILGMLISMKKRK